MPGGDPRDSGVCVDPEYTHSIRAYRYAGRHTSSIGAAEIAPVLDRAGCDGLHCIVRGADTYIVQTGTGKAEGLLAVRKYLRCADEPAAAIGDSDLDLEALESVEHSFAPANCAPGVRALARRGGCRIMREPMQRGLLAAAREVVGQRSGPRPAERPVRDSTGAPELLRELLEAADRPRPRRWLAACSWRSL